MEKVNNNIDQIHFNVLNVSENEYFNLILAICCLLSSFFGTLLGLMN